jgi:hypothetical protein
MPPDVELPLRARDAQRSGHPLFDTRTIPAGMEGVVLETEPDGTCLAELTFTPQTADEDGDFAQAVLTEGQYEIINP